jgi:O-antigen ligase
MSTYTQQVKSQFLSNFNHFFAVLILSIYPITFFIGTGILNLSVVLLDLILIFEIIRKKKFYFFKNSLFFFLIGLWLIFLLNLFFSISIENSLGRSIGFIRYILFVMSIIYYFNINNGIYRKIILNAWSIIFFIICFDLIYEFFLGKNILGFTSYMPGRLSSFFNDELKIGHFYYGFSLIVLSYLLNSKLLEKYLSINNEVNKKDFIFILALIFIVISFIIGERSNFIKTLTMLSLFIIFIKLNFNKNKLVIIIGLIIFFLLTLNFNQAYKSRFINQLIKPLLNNPITFVSSTNYSEHYKFGLKIFSENKFFGIGLKNYRIEVGNKNYVNSSIHPHQTHIEILSELGIVGYLSFVIFFILSYLNYKKNSNKSDQYFKLAGFLFIITSFIPLLPTGSFFTSHAATIFWMNYAFMNLSQKNLKL